MCFLKRIVFTSLANIKISKQVTSIEYGDFEGNIFLKQISIPSTVTSIGFRAFYNCSALTEIEIPPSVTTIGEHAFSSCNSLKRARIPSSLSIEDIGKIGIKEDVILNRYNNGNKQIIITDELFDNDKCSIC